MPFEISTGLVATDTEPAISKSVTIADKELALEVANTVLAVTIGGSITMPDDEKRITLWDRLKVRWLTVEEVNA